MARKKVTIVVTKIRGLTRFFCDNHYHRNVTSRSIALKFTLDFFSYLFGSDEHVPGHQGPYPMEYQSEVDQVEPVKKKMSKGLISSYLGAFTKNPENVCV